MTSSFCTNVQPAGLAARCRLERRELYCHACERRRFDPLWAPRRAEEAPPLSTAYFTSPLLDVCTPASLPPATQGFSPGLSGGALQSAVAGPPPPQSAAMPSTALTRSAMLSSASDCPRPAAAPSWTPDAGSSAHAALLASSRHWLARSVAALRGGGGGGGSCCYWGTA